MLLVNICRQAFVTELQLFLECCNPIFLFVCVFELLLVLYLFSKYELKAEVVSTPSKREFSYHPGAVSIHCVLFVATPTAGVEISFSVDASVVISILLFVVSLLPLFSSS